MSVPRWPALIGSLLGGADLTRDEAAWAMEQVMAGEATPVQLAGFLVALRAKGETVEELAGFVEVMLRHAVRIDVPGRCVDVVGTGGDRSHTVNISTMAAIVVAGTGQRVVKHGNRAASSSCGAADVLEALGVRLDATPARVVELAGEVGITFCFAQVFHPAFRHAGTARRELGVPTAFNFLGPLTNPAQPRAGAIGCGDLRMAPLLAGVLAERGTSALVFRGEDGLDELSTITASQVWVVADAAVSPARVVPVELGITPATLADLRGGDAQHNAAVVHDVLAGTRGPIRDAVLLNAAAALVAATSDAGSDARSPSLAERLVSGMKTAAQAIDSGAAADVLQRWVSASAR